MKLFDGLFMHVANLILCKNFILFETGESIEIFKIA